MQRPICSSIEPNRFLSKLDTRCAGSIMTRARVEAPLRPMTARLAQGAAVKATPATPACARNFLLPTLDMLDSPARGYSKDCVQGPDRLACLGSPQYGS